ncbi:hypothetical protein [Nocardia concava]|uniref:hypothetical protein n=1 Tax=Nocardia concava TaxID=257281 RepID=UPI0012FBA541|nr:hypothetical protein [Nocardia concava]
MRRAAGVLILGLLAASVVGCSSTPEAPAPKPAAAPAAAPRTAEPPAAAVSVAPGEVRLSPGPFTDRVRLSGTRLEGATVRGTLAITTDVSDVLALELNAAFYDAGGRLVGTGTFAHADEEPVSGGPHVPSNDGISFAITSAPSDASVAAAVLSIPVLVNE